VDYRKRLEKIYHNKITDNDSGKGIKFEFRFKDINTSVYYDSYDEKVPVFFMILEYKKDYIFKNFNINLLESPNFLSKHLPAHVVNNLAADDTLNEFVGVIAKVLSISDEYTICQYSSDKLFDLYTKNEASDVNNIRKIKPFFQGIRRRTMQESHLLSLYDALSVDMKILKYLQGKEYTIITSKNPYNRKLYTKELKKIIV